jgi:hypothetical protein
MSKTDNLLTPLEQLRHLCDALAEDTLKHDRRLTKTEQAALDRMKAEIVDFAGDYAARSQAEKTALRWSGGTTEWNTSKEKTRGG